MSENANKSEEIKAVIGSLFDSIMSEKNLETEQRIHLLTQEQRGMLIDPKNDFWIECALSEIKDMIAVLRGLPMYDNISTALIDGSLERFFSLYIEKTEGRGCSVDKSRFICQRIKLSILKGENLSLYADYTREERIPVAEQKKQAYWSPKNIKDTDEAKRIYLDWLHLKHV